MRLEEQVNVSNQNVLALEAQFRQARDIVRVARANLFPTLSTGPSIVNSQSSGTLYGGAASLSRLVQQRDDVRPAVRSFLPGGPLGQRSRARSTPMSRTRKSPRRSLKMLASRIMRSLRRITSNCTDWTATSTCWSAP